MELNVPVAPTSSPKREFLSLKQKSLKRNLMESIAKVNRKAIVSQFNADGTVRLKMLVRKQDLKQIIEATRDGRNNAHHQQFNPTFSSIEQRLSVLRRKHLMKATKESYRRGGSWIPALQTIPEEL